MSTTLKKLPYIRKSRPFGIDGRRVVGKLTDPDGTCNPQLEMYAEDAAGNPIPRSLCLTQCLAAGVVAMDLTPVNDAADIEVLKIVMDAAVGLIDRLAVQYPDAIAHTFLDCPNGLLTAYCNEAIEDTAHDKEADPDDSRI